MKHLNQVNEANHDIVVTGLGLLTANGVGLDINLEAFAKQNGRVTQDDYRIINFNAAPYLTDRKVVKVVSHRDVLGLVAFEECVRNSGLSSKLIHPDRTGLYVGAPPSSCVDHHNYHEAILASVDSVGILQEQNFGENFSSASPTTLLTGLPNNVLCYGSKTLDARGPNSNYTTLETSAHMAIIGATRSIRLNRLDCAIAGGYSAHSDKVFAAAMRRRATADRSTTPDSAPIAEGAAFMTIESRTNAETRGAKIICRILGCSAASDAVGPYQTNNRTTVLSELITLTLTKANTAIDDIEVIMTTGAESQFIRHAEACAVTSLWRSSQAPVIATTASRWGNLMEAGGIAEIGFLDACYRSGSVPKVAVVELPIDSTADHHPPIRVFNPKRPHALILRTTPWGEYTCLLVKMGAL